MDVWPFEDEVEPEEDGGDEDCELADFEQDSEEVSLPPEVLLGGRFFLGLSVSTEGPVGCDEFDLDLLRLCLSVLDLWPPESSRSSDDLLLLGSSSSFDLLRRLEGSFPDACGPSSENLVSRSSPGSCVRYAMSEVLVYPDLSPFSCLDQLPLQPSDLPLLTVSQMEAVTKVQAVKARRKGITIGSTDYGYAAQIEPPSWYTDVMDYGSGRRVVLWRVRGGGEVWRRRWLRSKAERAPS